MSMKREELVSFLESVNHTDVKINDEFTKGGLIKAINESTSGISTNVAALDAGTDEDKFYNIHDPDTKKSKSKSKEKPKKEELEDDSEISEDDFEEYLDDSEDEPDEVDEDATEVDEDATEVDEDTTEVIEEPEEKEHPMNALTLDNEIGYPRIAMDYTFNNMSDISYKKISNLLSKDELTSIKDAEENDSWVRVARKAVLCDLNQLASPTRKVVNCYDVDKQPTGKGKPRRFPIAYIKSYYNVKSTGPLKDVEGNNEFALMNQSDTEEKTYIIPLRQATNRNRYAILIESGDETPYLMIGSDSHTSFFYKNVVD